MTKGNHVAPRATNHLLISSEPRWDSILKPRSERQRSGTSKPAVVAPAPSDRNDGHPTWQSLPTTSVEALKRGAPARK